MTSQPPLQIIWIFLLTTLPIAECNNDGTPLLSVGGVLVMIVFTCCLCMCYRRMYEHRMAMAEAAHAPRAVIITCRRPSNTPTPVGNPAHVSFPGGTHLPYTPSPHFNPYAPRPADGVAYGHFDSSANYIAPAQAQTHAHAPAQLAPPSYESLFPAQNSQTNSNQPDGDARK